MNKSTPDIFISAPHGGKIYILELARAGCRKLVASAMPELPTDVDRRIELRNVPLSIRRAARKHLLGAAS